MRGSKENLKVDEFDQRWVIDEGLMNVVEHDAFDLFGAHNFFQWCLHRKIRQPHTCTIDTMYICVRKRKVFTSGEVAGKQASNSI